MDSMLNVNRWMSKLADAALAVTDPRRYRRVPANLAALLSGPHGTNTVTCVELSRGGVAVRVADPIEPGTLVFLRMTDSGLMGFAYVRHCRTENDSYRLGLQFRGALTREYEPEPTWNLRRVQPQLAWDEAEA